jgi:hypothetical protein
MLISRLKSTISPHRHDHIYANQHNLHQVIIIIHLLLSSFPGDRNFTSNKKMAKTM